MAFWSLPFLRRGSGRVVDSHDLHDLQQADLAMFRSPFTNSHVPQSDAYPSGGSTFTFSVLRAGQLMMRGGRGGDSGGGDALLDYEDLLSLDEDNPHRAVMKHVLDSQTKTKALKSGMVKADCLICMESFVQGQTEVMQLPCRHRFCASCVSRWLEQNISCPTCRYTFPESQTYLARCEA